MFWFAARGVQVCPPPWRRRNEARVLLVERAGFAGGIITCVGLAFFDGIADFFTRRVVTPGIPLELYSKSGGCAPDAKVVASQNPLIDNVERFKFLADNLIAEAPQLKVLYHSFVCGVRMKGNTIAAVQIANKNGLVEVEPRIVIDCTGDGDIAAWSGAPLVDIPTPMPMTLHWRVGNVSFPPWPGRDAQADAGGMPGGPRGGRTALLLRPRLRLALRAQ